MAPAATAAGVSVFAPSPSTARAGKARRNTQSYGLPTQRDRLVAATAQLAAELGATAIGVHHICQRAGVSRRTFYDLYTDRDACFVDAHQEAFGRLIGHLAEAVADAGPEWEDRAVAASQALLGVWEADRVLAHLCLVSSIGNCSETMALRRRAIAQIAALLADAPPQPLLTEPMLTGAIGGVWELALRTLTDEPARSITDLAGAAIYLMLAPFAGRRHAAVRAAGRGGATAYVTRWTPAVTGDADERGLLVTELTGQTLRYLNGHPGAANIDIARAVDVRHESQMSRHLGRLERAGMVSHRKEGRTNAWVLTARGEEAARTLHDLRADAPRLTISAWGSTNHRDA
jgi:AcrR family transcriptional regulator/DNA-binding MarR family transcriptional regulator